MMKKALFAGVILGVVGLSGSLALAGGPRIGIGIGIGVPAYNPYPDYYGYPYGYPYYYPRPVCVVPQPVYVTPPPAYVQGAPFTSRRRLASSLTTRRRLRRVGRPRIRPRPSRQRCRRRPRTLRLLRLQGLIVGEKSQRLLFAITKSTNSWQWKNSSQTWCPLPGMTINRA